MSGFWVEPQDVRGDELWLRGEEAHHLTHVRRCRQGDTVEAVDGAGRWYQARVERFEGRDVLCRVTAHEAERGESAVRLVLAAALISGPRFDYVVEKATEVGVQTIVPLLTERGVVRPGSQERPQRWERLVRAAVKQCGRSRRPAIMPAQPLSQALVWLRQEGRTVLLAQPGAGPLGEALGAYGAAELAVLIGPEGGFTDAEQELAMAAGARPFAWGERVLRAETAGVVLAALVMHEARRSAAAGEGRMS